MFAATKKYRITPYTYKRSKQLGVTVRLSTNPKKKLDVFHRSTHKKLASIGAIGMNDYPTYIREKGLKYAKTRRRLYKQRHEKDRHTRNTPGYFADQLLW
jgi:hypothetical protein